MDPNSNLTEQLRLAEKMLRDPAINPDDSERLAEIVLALDGWIRGGGFLPDGWNSRPVKTCRWCGGTNALAPSYCLDALNHAASCPVLLGEKSPLEAYA